MRFTEIISEQRDWRAPYLALSLTLDPMVIAGMLSEMDDASTAAVREIASHVVTLAQAVDGLATAKGHSLVLVLRHASTGMPRLSLLPLHTILPQKTTDHHDHIL